MAERQGPAGYVGMAEAKRITGWSANTIYALVQTGKLQALPRTGTAGSPLYFTEADLRRCRGLPPLEQAS